jgi:hypothetical protein
MTVKLPTTPPLSARYLREFNRVRDDVMHQLASAPRDVRMASATLGAPQD